MTFVGSYFTNKTSKSSSDSNSRSHSSSTETTPVSSTRACLTLFGQSPHKIFSRLFISGRCSVTSTICRGLLSERFEAAGLDLPLQPESINAVTAASCIAYLRIINSV